MSTEIVEPVAPWTKEQLTATDDVTKKELVTFLQENGSHAFLKERKLNGKLANVAKTAKRDDLISTYEALFSEKKFKDPKEVIEETVSKPETNEKTESAKVVVEVPKYVKQVIKNGDKTLFPKKGSTVECWYKGMLEDGTVFDELQPGMAGKKKRNPLTFKVGTGRVIRGWDEGLLTFSKGEKAKLIIEPEWAYGKKGQPDAKIPPNARLIFEVELVSVM